MKSEVYILENKYGEFYAVIHFVHALIKEPADLTTNSHKSKGQLKRKVIQFCSQLNLEVEFKL